MLKRLRERHHAPETKGRRGLAAFGRAPRVAALLRVAVVALLAFAMAPAVAQTDFNHDRTGYHLDGAHQKARCLSCHGQGILRGTPKLCAQCHVQGNRTGTTIVQAQTHIPVSVGVACDNCHTSQTSFRVWRMDHNSTPLAAANQCSVCHTGQSFEGVVPLTKPMNHPFTVADCSLCHTSTSTFRLVNSFDHAGSNIFAGTSHNCTTCHNGSQATGQPPGHIPVSGVQCDYCHTNTVSFASWNMSASWGGHPAANITVAGGGCASCHNGQSFIGVAPVSKPSGHLPTNLGCEVCHTATDPVPGGFAFVKAGNPHLAPAAPAPGTCTTCHNGVGATGQIGGHIPVNAQCDRCHSSQSPNFSTWTMDHSVVSATCSTCHSVGNTFPGIINLVTKAYVTHIPTSLECSTCHTTPASVPSPGSPPPGPTLFAPQINAGIHTGITTGCANCHNTGAPYAGIVTKPASGHIPTTMPCEACHTSTAIPNGFKTFTMNHAGIVTGCATCHDIGVSFLPSTPALVLKTATPPHIQTSAPCEWCHTNTVAFKPASMNHTGIVGNCNACHSTANAAIYAGGIVTQPPSHIPTGAQDCSACHTNTQVPGGFKLSVSSFDHVAAGVQPGTCTNCHNGVNATGQITGHIAVGGVQCDQCHNFSLGSFSKWTMNHASVSTTCSLCHGTGRAFPGATMVTLPANHFPIGTAECGTSCHRSPSSVVAPGGGSGFASWTMVHATPGLPTACGTCHAGGSYAGSVPVVGYPANHIPVTGGAASDCSTCHSVSDTPGSGAFKNFSTSLHTSPAIAGIQCKTCHDLGKTFIASTPPLVTRPAANHIPLTAGSLPASDCNACHTSTVVTGGFATWSMPSAHFGIATGCSSCHGSTVQLYPGVLHQVSGHTPTSAPCETCHNNTTVPGGFAFVVAGAGNPHTGAPNPVPTPGTCRNCHNGTTATGQIAGHIPTNANVQCDVCHSSTAASFATWTMNATTHGPANITQACSTCHAAGKSFPGAVMVTQGTVNHIPTLAGNECTVCHTGTARTPGDFAAWTMTNHSAVSTGSCATCHGAAASGFTNHGTAIVSTPPGHVAYTSGADCSKCHSNTTIPGGFATRATDHSLITTPATCATCHTGQVFPTGVTPKTNTSPGVTHIAILGGTDCNLCHSRTTVPGGFATRNMNHAGVNTATCNACHTGQVFSTGVTAKPKPVNHIPVGASDCSQCHSTTSTGGFAVFNMNHSAITLTPCATCHSVAGAATFLASTPALVTPNNAPGLHASPVIGAQDCSTSGCHSTSNTGPGGFALAGKIHTAADAGTCNTCHGAGGTAVTKQSAVSGAGHIATGATQCDQCHTFPSGAPPYATHFGTWTMRHSAVSGSACSTCHSPPGSPAKVATGPFGGAVTIIGAPASGSPNHVALTNTACNLCHTTAKDVTNATAAGSGATSGFATQNAGWTMNHAAVNTAPCTTCHSSTTTPVTFATGVSPVFKPANHVPTTPSTLDCATCHSSFTTFKVGSFSHTGIAAGCNNCHGATAGGPGIAFANVTPVFKPANHIATTALDCAVCHSNTSTFTAWTMQHSGVTAWSGSGPATPRCDSCHGNQSFATGIVPVAKPGNHIVTALDCAACHLRTSPVPGGFAGQNAGWRMGKAGDTAHTANGNTASCLACHNGQTFANGVAPVAKPATHLTTALDCATCHTNFTTFAGQGIGWNMSHTGIVANCTSCHNNQVFATGVVAVSKTNTPSPGHVPTTSDCSNCHPSTSTGGFATFSNLSGKHTAVYMTSYSTTCTVCHGQTSAIYFGVEYQCGGKGATISDHKSGGVCGGATKANCRSCHNATDAKW